MNFLDVVPSKNTFFFVMYFLLGSLLSLSFEPFKIPFFSILIIGLFYLLNDYSFRKTDKKNKIFFLNGIGFGFGFFFFSMYWISNSIIELDPNLNYLIPIPLIILPLSLSLFFGGMQLANLYLWSNPHSRIFYFSSIWIIFEFLRSILFTGLPWNLLGYSWSWSLEYSQIVSVIGIYGLGLVTVFCSTCLFSYILNRKNKFYFFLSIFILIVIYFFGDARLENNKLEYTDKEVRIIHTYFDQNNKWSMEIIDQIALMGSKNITTIFPETSLGSQSNWPENWFFGYIKKNKNKFYNSISYMGYTYDKKILVPFGEYLPFARVLNSFLPKNFFLQSSLSKGSREQTFYPNITPLICYEVIFPSFVRNNVSEYTDLLVNISNDAWFGTFSGPKQHFVHSRFRSIELGIPMTRSSNKGVSGLIGPYGQIIYQINTKESKYLDVKIPKKLDSTIYKKYGNLFTYFLIVLFFIIGYAISKKIIVYEKKLPFYK